MTREEIMDMIKRLNDYRRELYKAGDDLGMLAEITRGTAINLLAYIEKRIKT